MYTHYAVGYFSISIMASYGKNTKDIIIKKLHTHIYKYIRKLPWKKILQIKPTITLHEKALVNIV